MLDPDFEPYVKQQKTISEQARRILLFFGGSDCDLFALKAAQALYGQDSLHLVVLLGPGVPDAQGVADRLREMGTEVLHAIPSVARLMFEADMAVTHGGNTTFELASVGTPAITLCRRERQMKNANFFQSQGTLVNLGLGQQVSEDEIRDAVQTLASDKERRLRMSRAGRQTVDGRGLERVSEIVAEYLVQSSGSVR